jgi:hypothetical protein
MTFFHQQLGETLVSVKRINPLTEQLGHETRIRREVLTDMGVRTDSVVIVELDKVIDACKRGDEHGVGADPLYRLVKTAMFGSAVQSIFCPVFPH